MLPVDSVWNSNEADLFTNLPQEIIIDILSRLPVESITRCKCVCKPWHDLIESSEFVATHLIVSKSTSGLALIERSMASPCKIYTEVGVDGCTWISNFVLPTHPRPMPGTSELSSANGLILFFDRKEAVSNLFVCNPTTREYMELPPPPGYQPCKAVFGFGASKISGQYKVVVIFDERCMVYTLGIGIWRSIATIKHTIENGTGGFAATLMSGNLHWLGFDTHNVTRIFPVTIIYCLDLETEQCTSFSLPPPCDEEWCLSDGGYWVSVLDGRLSFCYRIYSKIVIWLMNKYGDESSWTKEFIMIARVPSDKFFFPLKIFRDNGDILFGANGSRKLFFYSNKSKRYQEYGHLQVQACGYNSSSVVTYTPSFLSLKTLGFQNVASF